MPKCTRIYSYVYIKTDEILSDEEEGEGKEDIRLKHMQLRFLEKFYYCYGIWIFIDGSYIIEILYLYVNISIELLTLIVLFYLYHTVI